jgi:hypothetical protein
MVDARFDVGRDPRRTDARLKEHSQGAEVRSVAAHELETVAEWIVDVKAIESGQRKSGLDRVSGRLAARDERREIVDEDGRMRDARRAEVPLDAEVDHDGTTAKPSAAATAEHLGTHDLGEPEHVDVELARAPLLAVWHGEEHVLEADEVGGRDVTAPPSWRP